MIPAHAPELHEKLFDADGVTLNYAEGPPSGSPMVLLHGVGRNWQDFLSLIPDLCKQWHVYALDLRGHGKSGRVANGYTSAAYAADVACFLTGLIREPAAVFGHSLGGVIGMRLAAHAGNSVSALVVGDSLLSRESLRRSLYQPLFAGLHRVVIQGGSVPEMACSLARIEIPVPMLEQPVAIGDIPGNDEAYLRRWANCLCQVDPDVFSMALAGLTLNDFDAHSLLPDISCPTLFLQANPDLGGLMSNEEVENAMRLLPRGRVVRFPLLGHALHLQRPQPVLDAVVSFLRSV